MTLGSGLKRSKGKIITLATIAVKATGMFLFISSVFAYTCSYLTDDVKERNV